MAARVIVVLDILAIAAGFVLRAARGRRRHRHLPVALVPARDRLLRGLPGRRPSATPSCASTPATGAARATLRRYSLGSLRAHAAGAAAGGGRRLHRLGVHAAPHVVWYELSIVPFLLWLGRYAALIGAGAGQAPEELILRDRTLLVLSVAWGLLFLGGVYVGH